MINIALTQETYNRIIRSVEITESQNNPSAQAALFASQQAVYAKVTGFDDEDEKRVAQAVEVVWDDDEFEFRELNEDEGDPFIYSTLDLDSESATLFTRTDIVSKSEMAVDDVFLLQYYPNLTEDEEWLVVETGGETTQWVKVVSGEEDEYIVIKIINSLDQTEVPGDNTPLLLLPAVPALDLEVGDILNCQLVSPSTDADKVYTPINNVFLR